MEKQKLRKTLKMRIISLVFVVLLVSVVFSPVVAAHSMEQSIAKTPIELISYSDTAKEYIVYTDETKDTAQYLIKQEMVTADQKQVWKAEVHEIMADGTVSNNILFGSDSYYWYDNAGHHFHFGPNDANLIKTGAAITEGAVISWILSLTGIGALAAGFIGGAIVAYLDSQVPLNSDRSLDVSFDDLTVTLIPVYFAMPGLQPVFITVNGGLYPFFV